MKIIGIFNIHGQGQLGKECAASEIREDGVQYLEAFNFALDMINNEQSLLGNLKLVGVAIDGCENILHLQRQLRLSLSVKSELKSADDVPFLAAVFSGDNNAALSAASVVNSYNLPTIITEATDIVLSDKRKYPNFLRTISSDMGQIKAIFAILKRFSWKYVTLIYSVSDDYYNDAIRMFIENAAFNNVCIVTQLGLRNHYKNDQKAMADIVQFYLLNNLSRSRIVVMFASADDVRAVLQAVEDRLGNQINDIVWIATKAWGKKFSIVQGLSKAVKTAITISFAIPEQLPFAKYFSSLRPGENLRNPWFDQFWQHHFNCFRSSAFKKYFNITCDPRWYFSSSEMQVEDGVASIIDAVYAIAIGIRNLLRDICGSVMLCVPVSEISKESLFNHMKTLAFFNGLTRKIVKFDAYGNNKEIYHVWWWTQKEIRQPLVLQKVIKIYEGMKVLDVFVYNQF